MANTKISALTANTNPTWSEEFVYAYNNANGKITLNTVKSFIGSSGITTLNADANIWELSEWFYETTYDLYYKTGEAVPVIWATWATKKQLLLVTKESTWEIWYFVLSEWHKDTTYTSWASYWYSISSSVWRNYQLWSRDWALKEYEPVDPHSLDSFSIDSVTQVITNIWSGTNNLRIDSVRPPYPWLTYTVYVESVDSGEDYTIWLGTGVTNPFGITLPTSSTKKCVITCLITSTTSAIVTGCTIEP